MCGVVASYSYAGREESYAVEDLQRARDSMWYRGPDASGLWEDREKGVILGHRRLAIIDLQETSNQPMKLAHADLWITFNGEIFNYQELRALLQSEGAQFTTNSDTEVILQLYRIWGVGGLKRLRGMFAFALWEGPSETLLVVRDPLGIKPLYVCDDGKKVLVASQVRAIAAVVNGLTADPIGHCGFFVNGYVPEPNTMFREIKSVPAGQYYMYRRDGLTVGIYYSLTDIASAAADRKIDESERADIISSAIRNSISRHLVSDVDVGVFLSAGVDSTLLAWSAIEQGGVNLSGITLGAREYIGTSRDEIPLAHEFANFIGMSHRSKYVDASNFVPLVDELIERMDQPSIDGVNTYLVSRMAQEFGFKVALSGLGGDELFAGYPGHKQIPRIVRAVRALGPIGASGKVMRELSSGLIGRLTSPKYASLVELGGSFSGAYLLRRALYLPWEVNQLDRSPFDDDIYDAASCHGVTEDALSLIPSPVGRVALLEMTRYMRNQLLRDSDWAGMASSLEIRVPFVDSELVEKLAPLIFADRPISKLEVVTALNHPMASEIAKHKKRGFGLPVRDWMSDRLPSKNRGLRDWANHIYAKWCQSVGVEPIVLTDRRSDLHAHG